LPSASAARRAGGASRKASPARSLRSIVSTLDDARPVVPTVDDRSRRRRSAHESMPAFSTASAKRIITCW